MKKYFYLMNNEQHGPVSLDELRQAEITNSTLIWFEGLDDWKKAEDISEMQPILELIPPPLIKNEKHLLKNLSNAHLKARDVDYKQSQKLNGVKGWLLLLCNLLVVFGPIASAYFFYVSFSLINSISSNHYKVLLYIDSVLSLLLTVLSIRAGMALWKIKPRAVRTAKTYLWCYLMYHILSLFLPYLIGVKFEHLKELIPGLVTGLMQSLIFFGVWFSYLSFSKRVKVTYSVNLNP